MTLECLGNRNLLELAVTELIRPPQDGDALEATPAFCRLSHADRTSSRLDILSTWNLQHLWQGSPTIEGCFQVVSAAPGRSPDPGGPQSCLTALSEEWARGVVETLPLTLASLRRFVQTYSGGSVTC